MLKTLLKSVRQYKKETLLSPLCVVVEVFIEMYIPYIMGLLIDNGINKGNMDYVRKMGLFTILLTLVSLVLGASASYFSAHAAAGFTANLRHHDDHFLVHGSFDQLETDPGLPRGCSGFGSGHDLDHQECPAILPENLPGL
ncbi:hypothetical protein BTI57_03605 [Lactobacillus delbrueckii subsp. bulgaricus]|nr:hypothetical protein [Lactobacillus delbrueckii subsp. bulgaricus]